jgi:transposase
MHHASLPASRMPKGATCGHLTRLFHRAEYAALHANAVIAIARYRINVAQLVAEPLSAAECEEISEETLPQASTASQHSARRVLETQQTASAGATCGHLTRLFHRAEYAALHANAVIATAKAAS